MLGHIGLMFVIVENLVLFLQSWVKPNYGFKSVFRSNTYYQFLRGSQMITRFIKPTESGQGITEYGAILAS